MAPRSPEPCPAGTIDRFRTRIVLEARMTTPFRCLFILAVLPYVLAGLGGYLRVKQLGHADNNHPRIQALKLQGAAARALAAQANAWEALTVFGIVAIVAHLVGADAAKSATASLVYLATRIAHPVLYIADLATVRTLVFTVGLGCIVWMMSLSWAAA
jgi:uncharacterized MAPEG superfamily protein